MIPPFAPSGVLPPYIGPSPADILGVSPYRTTMSEIATTLATTKERAKLCRGLLDYREALRAIGITRAVQWINGSFCENVEVTRGKPPADIDVVTLLLRPPSHQDDAAWVALVTANLHVFDPAQTKAQYHCDAYPIDLHLPLDHTISQLTYWFGLFTHKRTTTLWKGILQVPILSDDVAASANVAATLNPPLLTAPLP